MSNYVQSPGPPFLLILSEKYYKCDVLEEPTGRVCVVTLSRLFQQIWMRQFGAE